ncbi:MAG: indole-3-glycerol phosphate synthase TrpC [Flavobacteriaceae bacterium]|nr:indole-3-glycerol phosphate synthase TrpC [Flavobacteriaceae bacterium]
MNILDKIVANKIEEVKTHRLEIPVAKLVKSPNFKRASISLKKSLLEVGSNGIIAEFKRQSPSKGTINARADIEKVTLGYVEAGVAAQSILTDYNYFGGSFLDLVKARSVQTVKPILRKDFIIDGYQIVESKAIGADAILLIASILTKDQIKQFSNLAADLGLEVLYEIHNAEELDKIDADNKIIGINNRNLKTFEVDLENSIRLASSIPDNCIKVSESGISNPETVKYLRENGFNGFLIGENFMKAESPEQACVEFLSRI